MSAGIMLRSFAALLVCVLGVGQTRGETPWTAVLTQQALAAGYPATLPPNLSMVLGLAAQGKSVQVKQLVTRAEQKVRTFNVSVAHHRDLVIFLVDEGTQATVAYLLGPGGKLRRRPSPTSSGRVASCARPSLTRSGLSRGNCPLLRRTPVTWLKCATGLAAPRSCRARRIDRPVVPTAEGGRHVLD